MWARLKNTIRTSTPWEPERCAQAGEIVWAEPATNLPADSRIKYWLDPEYATADWAGDADGPYGVGAYADDIVFLDG